MCVYIYIFILFNCDVYKFVLHDKQCKNPQYFPQLYSIHVHADGSRDRNMYHLILFKVVPWWSDFSVITDLVYGK